jgi:hypothetical protein
LFSNNDWRISEKNLHWLWGIRIFGRTWWWIFSFETEDQPRSEVGSHVEGSQRSRGCGEGCFRSPLLLLTEERAANYSEADTMASLNNWFKPSSNTSGTQGQTSRSFIAVQVSSLRPQRTPFSLGKKEKIFPLEVLKEIMNIAKSRRCFIFLNVGK